MTTTPALSTGTYWVDLPCPRCGVLAQVSVHLGSSLTVPDDGGPSLRLTAKSKAIDHWCGQRAMISTPDLALFDPDDDPAAEVERRRHPT